MTTLVAPSVSNIQGNIFMFAQAFKKKKAKGDPAAQHLTCGSIDNFVGEEAPVARAGPRSPDALYRGEEAGAALKPAAQE